MPPNYEVITVSSPAGWGEALRLIAAARHDVLLVTAGVKDVTTAGNCLQRLIGERAQMGILAGTTLKNFGGFDGERTCVFSAGRKILSPLGLSAERSNLRWGQGPSADGEDRLELAESVWGSVVYLKRTLLDQVKWDTNYISTDGSSPIPNLLIDDLCLQAKLEGFEVGCTAAVSACVDDAAVTYPDNDQPAYAHWENKWGWHPLVPNVYKMRIRWNGTPLGPPMIEALMDSWDAEEPTIDVMMMTGNALEKLQSCMENLAQTKYPRLRFHILMNGSGEPVRRYLSSLSTGGFPFPLDVQRSPVNVGVPAGLNWLLTKCTAPLVLRLDDDIELPPDGLSRMVETMRKYPFAGAVMPAMTIHQAVMTASGPADCVVQPMRISPRLCGTEPADKMPGYPFRSIYLSNFMIGAIVLYRKKAIDLAGGFDLHYSPTQNEDIDHGVAVRAQGYDLVVDGRVMSRHYTGGMVGGSNEYVEGCLGGRRYFYKKWGKAPDILEQALDRDGRIVEL